MARWFNTAGPCDPRKHFMLPAAARLPTVAALVEREAYFVVHAPRQCGKTTALLALSRELTASASHAALLFSCEGGEAVGDDYAAAQRWILSEIRRRAELELPPSAQPPAWPPAPDETMMLQALATWARVCPLPLVLFFDEIDALRGESLRIVLRQLRAGYTDRPRDFPASAALCGLRDVRDYKAASGGGGQLGTSSPFNIKIESLTLADFTRDEVATLYRQHTVETGQGFTEVAVDRAWELTRGQPWLVNAIAAQLVDRLVTDRARPIDAADVDRARDVLIERQDTHLDSLAERLREERVRRVVEPLLAGASGDDLPSDDVRFVADLGLVRRDATGKLEVANPIYREVIPHVLSDVTRAYLPSISPSWLDGAGRLDGGRLLDAFLAFWRQHGEPLMRTSPYHEIAPHLVLMAFLHRVVNGGGSLEREYAVGRGRMDLCVRYGDVTLGIELKIWRDGQKDPLAQGLSQLDGYLAGLGLQTGWLVIFDRRSGQPPIEERTSAAEATTPAGRRVAAVRA